VEACSFVESAVGEANSAMYTNYANVPCPLGKEVELMWAPEAGRRRYGEERTVGVPCPEASGNLCYSASCGPPLVCEARVIEEHPPQRN